GYLKLMDQFPQSENLKFYKFRSELSEIREPIYSVQTDPQADQAKLDAFMKEYKGEQLLKDHVDDIRATYFKIGERYCERANNDHDQAALERARAIAELLRRIRPTKEDNLEQDLATRIETAVASIAAFQKLQYVRAELDR